MAADDAVKTLEQFMDLASKEIGVIAAKLQSDAPAQGAVVALLGGLSAAAQKSTSDFAEVIESLSDEDREAILSTLESSGVVNIMNLLTPLLKMGDAADLSSKA
jgi:hypothetical protein